MPDLIQHLSLVFCNKYKNAVHWMLFNSPHRCWVRRQRAIKDKSFILLHLCTCINIVRIWGEVPLREFCVVLHRLMIQLLPVFHLHEIYIYIFIRWFCPIKGTTGAKRTLQMCVLSRWCSHDEFAVNVQVRCKQCMDRSFTMWINAINGVLLSPKYCMLWLTKNKTQKWPWP